eukprot:COSAG02_NODE_10849_length_1846_cov_1.688609_2_plen_223_part_00
MCETQTRNGREKLRRCAVDFRKVAVDFRGTGACETEVAQGPPAQLTKPCCDQKQKEFRTSWRRLGHPQLASSGSATADATTEKASYAAADKKLEKSVRFATDPVTNMFSAGMLSINGTTISSHASNVADVSYLQLRTEHTKAGADGPGSAGLLSFNQKMTHEEVDSDDIDFVAGGSDTSVNSANGATTAAGLDTVYSTPDERSDNWILSDTIWTVTLLSDTF